MRVLCSLLLLLTNVIIFGAEFQIDPNEKEALIQEYTKKYTSPRTCLRLPPVEELRKGKDIDFVFAARQGNLPLCTSLIAEGIKVTTLYKSAFYEAIMGNHFDCVKLFLSEKPQLIEMDYTWFLELAAGVGSIEITKLLCDKGLRIHAVVLKKAIQNGRREFVKWLIEEKGVSVHPCDPIMWSIDVQNPFSRINGLAPIHEAAIKGDNFTIELLHKHGADINIQDYDNDMTPLKHASKHGHKHTVDFLKKLGAHEKNEEQAPFIKLVNEIRDFSYDSD